MMRGGMRARGLEEIGKDAVDLINLKTNVFDHFPGRAGGRQIATNDVDNSGNSGERVANFMSKSRSQLAERGQVLGARHLCAMHGFYLQTAFS